MTAELDAEVERTKQILEERREAAEAALQSFAQVVAGAAKPWMTEGVKAEVTRDHETTEKLGATKLGALKSELAKLEADALKLVLGWLDRREVWFHRVNFQRDPNGNSGDDSYRVQFYDKGPPDHSRARPWPLRKALGEVPQEFMRQFMTKHGYLQGRRSYFPPFEWNADQTNAINVYATAYEAFAKAKQAFEAATDAKGKHSAANLWDKV